MSSIFNRRAIQGSPAQAILIRDLTRVSSSHTLDLSQVSTQFNNFYEMSPSIREQDVQIDRFITRKLNAASTSVTEDDDLDFYEFSFTATPVTWFSAWKDSVVTMVHRTEETLKKIAGYRLGWSLVAATLLVSTITFMGFRYLAVSAVPSTTTISTTATQGNLNHANQSTSHTSDTPAHNKVESVKSDNHLKPAVINDAPTNDTPASAITPVIQPGTDAISEQPVPIAEPNQAEPATPKVVSNTDSGNTPTVTQSCLTSSSSTGIKPSTPQNNSCSVANVVSSTAGADKSTSVPAAPILSQQTPALVRLVPHLLSSISL